MSGPGKLPRVVEGIPCFSPDRYWGKAPREELERAVRLIEEWGWSAFKKDFPDRFDFTFEENRADWRFLIPVSKNYRVLDIGAGLGRISVPLARVVKEVVAVDQSFLRMKFLKLRAIEEGLGNIEVCVGDVFDLSDHFPQESFDLVVMNGLLEWVGVTERFSDPREAQLASLRIARALLKPGGHLYIGIENRWAFAYLRGVDHSGLRFTNFLPRWLANGYSLIRKKGRYATYTYGRQGYGRLLEEAGFKKSDFYLVYPGYNNPRIIVPYDNLSLLRYVLDGLVSGVTRRQRVIKVICCFPLSLRLYRRLLYSFNIISLK